MRDFGPLIEVDLREQVFDKLIAGLEPGQKLTASAVLTALDSEGEADAFREMNILVVPLDISDLPRGGGHGEAATRLRREEQLAKQGDLLTTLEETDPLRVYLEEIAGIPVCGDIQVLATELQEANQAGRDEPELWNKLLNLSLSRVVEIAQEYTGYGVLLMDLIQEASLVLWNEIPNCCGDFEALRDACIHHAMKKAVILQAYSDGVGYRMRQAMEDYRSVDERLLGDLGRNPTVEEIAEAMHITPEAAAAVGKMVENARILAQAKKAPEPEEEEIAETQAVEDTAYFQMRHCISDLLSELSEQDRKLLTLRYGLEGGLPLSPEDAGRQLGLTPEEVVSREAAALAKLRQK